MWIHAAIHHMHVVPIVCVLTRICAASRLNDLFSRLLFDRIAGGRRHNYVARRTRRQNGVVAGAAAARIALLREEEGGRRAEARGEEGEKQEPHISARSKSAQKYLLQLKARICASRILAKAQAYWHFYYQV